MTDDQLKNCARCGEDIIAEQDPAIQELCEDCEATLYGDNDQKQEKVGDQKATVIVCYDDEALWDFIYGEA